MDFYFILAIVCRKLSVICWVNCFLADLRYKQIKYIGTLYFRHTQVNYTWNFHPIFVMINFMPSMPVIVYLVSLMNRTCKHAKCIFFMVLNELLLLPGLILSLSVNDFEIIKIIRFKYDSFTSINQNNMFYCGKRQ